MRFSSWCSVRVFCVSLPLLVCWVMRRRQPDFRSWHNPGDDFYLADYRDTIKYFHALAASSDRIKMFTVGKSTEGKDIEVAVISSPENLAELDEYKKIAGGWRARRT